MTKPTVMAPPLSGSKYGPRSPIAAGAATKGRRGRDRHRCDLGGEDCRPAEHDRGDDADDETLEDVAHRAPLHTWTVSAARRSGPVLSPVWPHLGQVADGFGALSVCLDGDSHKRHVTALSMSLG